MKFKLQGGFTLLELMLVVAILGIMSTIGVSSYAGMSNRWAAKSFGEELEKSFVIARQSAMTQGDRVVVCPVTNVVALANNANCNATWGNLIAGAADDQLGWIVFADDDRNNTIENVNEQLIQKVQYNDRHGKAEIRNSSFAASAIAFSRKGALSSAPGTIQVASSNAAYQLSSQRNIVISQLGRIRNVKN